MSSRFEVVFSMVLRDDTPLDVLAELRFHLGLSDQRPPEHALDTGFPALGANPASYLVGDEAAVLRRQYRHSAGGVDRYGWALHVRQLWKIDHWAHVWFQTVLWLAPYVGEDGFIASYRDLADAVPTVAAVRDGVASLYEPGAEPLVMG